MPSQDINIIIRLTDNVSKGLKNVTGGLNTLNDKAKQFAMSMRQTGKQISSVGMTMGVVGTAITAPLILAFKETSKYSWEAHQQMKKLSETFTQLQVSVGQQLIPYFTRLANLLADLTNRWTALDPVIKQHIINTAMMVGTWLMVGGTILVVVGKTLTTLANLVMLIKNAVIPAIQGIFMALQALWAGNPFAWIVLAVAGIVVAILKWREVSDSVLNAIEVGVDTVAIGYEKVCIAIWNICKAYSYMTLNFKMAEFFKGQITYTEGLIAGLEKKIQNVFEGKGDFKGTADEIRKVADGIGGKFGEWKEKILDGTTSLGEFANFLRGINGETVELKKTYDSFWEGLMIGFDDAVTELGKWSELGQKVAKDMTSSMTTTMSSFINDVFTGQLKKGSDYFKAFGQSLLKIWSDTLAQMLVKKLMSGIFGESGGGWGSAIKALFGMGGGSAVSLPASGFIGTNPALLAGHTGGLIVQSGIQRYHSGGLVGDEVPIIAQTGERILSRTQNADYESGNAEGKTINYYIYAVDASSFAQLLYKNKASLHALVSEGMKKNSSMRGAMKTYA